MTTDKPKWREWTLTGEYIYYKDYGGQGFSHGHRATAIFPQIPIGATVNVIDIQALMEAERERDEAIRKYASIELAKSELTRNDHATFGDLILKNKKQSEIINKLASVFKRIQNEYGIESAGIMALDAIELLAKHRGEP